jgi:hypothetical protein
MVANVLSKEDVLSREDASFENIGDLKKEAWKMNEPLERLVYETLDHVASLCYLQITRKLFYNCIFLNALTSFCTP